MDNKQKKFLSIAFLIGNLIFWSIGVFPIFVKFYRALTKPPSLTSATVPRPQTSGDILQRIDFYNLRDPFSIPRKKVNRKVVSTKPSHTKKPNTRSARYVSSFKLNSIVLLENRNVASLQKKAGTSTAQNTPYSYRFGPQQPIPRSKTYSALEGDVFDGEKVIKITKDSVILSKNNQYYKLTFSGGRAIDKP